MTAERTCDVRLALLREHLSAEFGAYERGGVCFVVTPFLRHDNDPVTLRIDEDKDGRLLITDGGETIDYLRLSGYAVRRNLPFRKHMQAIEQSFGVQIEDEEILLLTEEQGVAEALAAVARAAQHTSYLVYRRRARGTARFEERVEVELIGVRAQYERDWVVQGRTGPRRFSFFVDGARNALLQPLSGTSQDALTTKAERFVFRIIDVRAAADVSVAPPREYRFVPVLNDMGRTGALWDPKTVAALEEYSDGLVWWSSANRRAELATVLGMDART